MNDLTNPAPFPTFQPNQVPSPPLQPEAPEEQRPKRGPRKQKAEGEKAPKKERKKRTPRVTTVSVLDGATGSLAIDPISKVDIVLHWFDTLISLDPAARKQVLEKLLA